MNRRDFIRYSTVLAAAGNLPGFAMAEPKPASRWQLEAGPITMKFEDDQPAPARLMGFNGATPGPVLRLPQGKTSTIDVSNRLDQATAIHWHGLRIDNAMDGVPGMTQSVIEPGETFQYLLNPPDAGTYWYHSHQRSWEQMARGLSGVLIVEEEVPQAFDQDLVFALDDWRLSNSLQLDEASFGALHDWAHGGRLGNFLTVNGQSLPGFRVISGQRIRLRVLNIANARIMTLRFPQGPAWIIARDGQPLPPVLLEDNIITLAPGQRIDLALDLSASPGSQQPVEVLVRDQVLEVADFVYHQSEQRQRLDTEPLALPLNPLHTREIAGNEDILKVPLDLQGGAMGRMREAIFKGQSMSIRELSQQGQVWAINGVAGLPDNPLFSVRKGTSVSLEVINDNAWPHGIHVHGHHFQDSRDPGVWQDTALFNRTEKASLQFVADNPGKWLIHCHMIEHQAAGMKTWFEVS